MTSNGGTMMTEKQKDYVIRRWNLFESTKRIRMAAKYFKLKRSNQLEMSWWQFQSNDCQLNLRKKACHDQ
jgi:hypothetical protein